MKHFYFLMKGLLLVSTLCVQAQSHVEVGENDLNSGSQSDQFLPTSFSNAKVQILITNTELTSLGLTSGSEISGIEWYVVNDGTPETTTFNIYMDGEYSEEQLSSDAQFATIDPVLVAENVTDSGVYTGWHTATFTTNYTWNGTDNLVVQVCRTGGNQSGDDTIEVSNTTAYTFVTGYNQPCAATTGYYSKTRRPHLRLIATTGALSSDDFTLKNTVKVTPNPSDAFIQLSNLDSKETYSIYNLLGKQVAEGSIAANEQIDISNFTKGIYVLKLGNGTTHKFIKQ